MPVLYSAIFKCPKINKSLWQVERRVTVTRFTCLPLSISSNQAVMIFTIIIKLRPTTLRQIQIPEFPSN